MVPNWPGRRTAGMRPQTNPLHAACGGCGMQLLAPRRLAGRGLGHGRHEPRRLRGSS